MIPYEDKHVTRTYITCEWSVKQQKLEERYKNRINMACAKAISEQKPEHVG